MKPQGTVKGILIEGSDGRISRIPAGSAGSDADPEPPPDDGRFSAVDDIGKREVARGNGISRDT